MCGGARENLSIALRLAGECVAEVAVHKSSMLQLLNTKRSFRAAEWSEAGAFIIKTILHRDIIFKRENPDAPEWTPLHPVGMKKEF